MLASAPAWQVSTRTLRQCPLDLDLQEACDLGGRSELRHEMEVSGGDKRVGRSINGAWRSRAPDR